MGGGRGQRFCANELTFRMAEMICIWSWCIYVLRGHAWASEAHPSFDAVRDWHQSHSLCHRCCQRLALVMRPASVDPLPCGSQGMALREEALGSASRAWP